MPTRNAAITTIPVVNNNTCESIERSKATEFPGVDNWRTITRLAHEAITHPHAVPDAARMSASARSWRTRLQREAPRATLILNS